MKKVVAHKKRKTGSLISDPKFKECVRNFDFKDPEFLKKIDRKDKASEKWIADLKRRQIECDRMIDSMCNAPFRGRVKD